MTGAVPDTVDGPTIKCVVWDLDNTLWDGTLLEDGQVTLRQDVAELIRELDRRGILNSIASRNSPADAIAQLEAFGLSEYFLYPEIGWQAKSLSVKRIVDNINIGADTVVFIDDQPFERDEVASTLPDVWCLDAAQSAVLLDHARANPKYLTADSSRRRQMYLDDARRKQEEELFEGPAESFLRKLGMVLDIAEAGEDDLMRAEELTYRTTQLNATGRSYTVEKLDEMRRSGSHRILVCELSDCYGSYGKVGLGVIGVEPGVWRLELLLFSCRVMSKGVGTVFLTYLRRAAHEQGVRLLADFRETARNRAMFIAYSFAGFSEMSRDADGMIVMENRLEEIPPVPDHLAVNINVDWSGA